MIISWGWCFLTSCPQGDLSIYLHSIDRHAFKWGPNLNRIWAICSLLIRQHSPLLMIFNLVVHQSRRWVVTHKACVISGWVGSDPSPTLLYPYKFMIPHSQKSQRGWVGRSAIPSSPLPLPYHLCHHVRGLGVITFLPWVVVVGYWWPWALESDRTQKLESFNVYKIMKP